MGIYIGQNIENSISPNFIKFSFRVIEKKISPIITTQCHQNSTNRWMHVKSNLNMVKKVICKLTKDKLFDQQDSDYICA